MNEKFSLSRPREMGVGDHKNYEGVMCAIERQGPGCLDEEASSSVENLVQCLYL